MNNFHVFASAVHARLETLKQGEFFKVDVMDFPTTYLLAFPEGTNPIFRTNTEHDCSCCKNFLKHLGNLVTFQNGKRTTIWDIPNLPYPYDIVARTLHNALMQAPITGVFRTKEHRFGAEHTLEVQADGHVHKWNHFHGATPRRCISIRPADDAGSFNTSAQVLKRGLIELTPAAVQTTLDLIFSNQLYRGAEHKAAVEEFQRLQTAYRNAPDPDALIWSNLTSNAARFRNTVIGTLVQDLSEGIDIERAVKSFETKVAPYNYKRSSAPISNRMVDDALATLQSLNLEDAVQRRYANASDLSINDIFFVDNGLRASLKQTDLKSILSSAVKPTPHKVNSAAPISMSDFLSDILPTAISLDAFVKPDYKPNFVSLTAPANPNSGQLFRWSNNFGWSYNGDVTDSIREKVKKAGGNIDAKLRVSLRWFNGDDLDLHAMNSPDGHIYFGRKAGILDVDMNAGGASNSVDPVENLAWPKPKDGNYSINVHQYCRRSTENPGFILELSFDGQIQQFSYTQVVNGSIPCFNFTIQQGLLKNLTVGANLTSGLAPSTFWNITTNSFVPVQLLLTSPNHWENSGHTGNQHWFFILKDCLNPDETRGFYNEFLNPSLVKHSKVFEVLANRMKCPPTTNQLSGLGFSTTQRNNLLLRVTTADAQRQYTINF